MSYRTNDASGTKRKYNMQNANFVTLYDMTVCSLHMICKEEEVKSDRKRMFIYMSTNQIGYEHK